MWILLLAFAGCGGAPEDDGGSALCNVDSDGDGFGTTTTVAATSCTDGGVTDNAADCDDAATSVHPGASETAGDGIDQDCDGTDVCFEDLDGDGYGGVSRLETDCAAAGLVGLDGDCNESDAVVHPGAEEIPLDAIDQDCGGSDACATDNDGDGFGTSSPTASADADCADEGEADDTDDCLDVGADGPATFPGSAENESASACMTDADGDGYGSSSPAEGVTAGRDCDDADADPCPAIHVGYDVEFTSGVSCSTVPDYMMGVIVTVERPMIVTALGHIADASAANFRMALYTDDDGPDALVVEAGPEALVDGALELPVSSTPISAGAYWIMANYDAQVRIPCGWALPPCRWQTEIPFDGPMPDPFGASQEGFNLAWNYYIVGWE